LGNKNIERLGGNMTKTEKAEKIIELKQEKKSKDLNIYQKMNLIMKDVKGINKDGMNSHQKYKYVSHDQVAGLLHKPLADYGIMVIPTIKGIQQDGNRTMVDMDIGFVNIENPEDRVHVRYLGYGIDPQDKGIGKAVSYAVKYCLLKTFCLETGDDVEKDNMDHIPAKTEIEDIEKLFKDVIPSTENFEEILKYVSFCAKKFKKEEEIIKRSAISQTGKFLASYKQWKEAEISE
jgi:hypothetical protein